MRLRTTLHLASFFPIAITALFILYLFTVHFTIMEGAEGASRIPMAGAVFMSVFSLLVGWRFYRAGQRLVDQVDTLESMAERVKRGDLKPAHRLSGGKGEVAEVTEVFNELVVELHGYVQLIGEHERLKQDFEAAHATAEKLRESAVQVSGALELLYRAEQGVIAGLLDFDEFVFSWLPSGALRSVLGLVPDPAQPLDLPPDIRDVFRRLAAALSPVVPVAAADRDEPLAEAVSARDALEDAVRLCRWKWEREGGGRAALKVSVAVEGAAPFDVRIGRLSLVQIFTAILMNAADAMPEGGPIAVEIATDVDGTVTMSMTDHGVGMSDSNRARCMKPFFSTKEGRIGMGLTLASRLLARGGGRLGVIGEPGHGTAVHLSFPRPVRQTRPGAVALARRAPLKILLVEDDEAVRDLLLTMLRQDRHEVIAAPDGASAVLLLRQQPFDLVMTDRAMPIMSGEELAVVVKSRYPGTPVVLVTAAGDEMTRRHMHTEGVDVILPKPVLRDDLKLAIGRAMAQR